MCIAVFPSQGSLWLNNSLYPPISLHHLSSSFKSTQYFLNPQVPTDLKKNQKTTNPQPKEESACDLLENQLIFSNSPFSPWASKYFSSSHGSAPTCWPEGGKANGPQCWEERSIKHWDVQQTHFQVPHHSPNQLSILGINPTLHSAVPGPFPKDKGKECSRDHNAGASSEQDR